jgi:deazaflavin-dependent oxidoreductase (nitroreductase family)
MFAHTIRSADRAVRARRAIFGPLTWLLNPLIRRLAGRPGVPLVGLVQHRGRRSGRTYVTPVGVGTTDTSLLIPLTFGSGSDWCRNVLAAGGGTVTWRGIPYTAREAALVEDASIRVELATAFGRFQRFAFRLMGTHQFLRLTDLLVATEGGETTVATRRAASCQVREVGSGPSGGHSERHIVFVTR